MLHNFSGIFENIPIRAAFLGWLIAQFIKVPIGYALSGKVEWRRMLSSGGMPSSHSSAICATTVSIGMMQGFASSTFALAAVMSCVVMFDAAGVRRATGKHAVLLNEIVDILRGEVELTDDRLKEWIGHTPFEVFVGAWLGLLTGIVTTLIWVKPTPLS